MRTAKRHLTTGTTSTLAPPPHGVNADSPPTPVTIQKTREGQETLTDVCGTSRSVIPFCVDTSWEAFFSFFALMRGIRETRGSGNALSGHTPNDATKASGCFSEAFEGVEHSSRTGSGDIEPQSSTPGECSPNGYSDARKLDGQPKMEPDARKSVDGQPKIRHGSTTALADSHDFILAPGPVETEVWRCVLKLLKVNLFHLTHVGSIRSACRGNDSARGINPTPAVHGVDIHTPGVQVGGAKDGLEGICTDAHRDLKEGVSRKADAFQESALRSKDNGKITTKGEEEAEAMPGRKGIMVLPAVDQEDCHAESGESDDRYGVIQDIYATLRSLLESGYNGECLKTRKAAEAVQVSSVVVSFVLVVQQYARPLNTIVLGAKDNVTIFFGRFPTLSSLLKIDALQ